MPRTTAGPANDAAGDGIAVHLEEPATEHGKAFLDAVHKSRTLHRAYVSPPASPQQYDDYLRAIRDENREAFFIVTADGRIAGVVNVTEIVRGNFQSAYLGYYALRPLAGKGLMRRGLALVVGKCFRQLGLHRVEANIQPGNLRSIALVQGLGFRLEGYSPRYLKIGGRWRDHQRWAVLADEWKHPSSGRGD